MDLNPYGEEEMTAYTHGRTIVFYAALALLLAGSVSALRNPMAVYCERLGYSYVTQQTHSGSAGFCVMPDGSRCLASEFVQGVCGEKFSYCSRNGLEMKTGTGEAKCVLKDGSEVWVTQLVKDDASLGSYVEEKLPGQCGNGQCEPNEDPQACPSDCTQTTTVLLLCGNSLCDAGESSLTCPDDCPKPPAAKAGASFPIIPLLIIIAAIVAYLLIRKTRK